MKNLFCDYCPCVWCDGNKENNKKATGYEFIPDPDHCKEMFKSEKELTYNMFLNAIFELHGNTLNNDWYRFLDKNKDGDII